MLSSTLNIHIYYLITSWQQISNFTDQEIEAFKDTIRWTNCKSWSQDGSKTEVRMWLVDRIITPQRCLLPHPWNPHICEVTWQRGSSVEWRPPIRWPSNREIILDYWGDPEKKEAEEEVRAMLCAKDPTFSCRLWRWGRRAWAKEWCGLEGGKGKETESPGDPPEMYPTKLNFSPMRSTSDFLSIEYRIRKKCVGLSWWSVRLWISAAVMISGWGGRALCWALRWAWSQLWILSLTLPLPPPSKKLVCCVKPRSLWWFVKAATRRHYTEPGLSASVPSLLTSTCFSQWPWFWWEEGYL